MEVTGHALRCEGRDPVWANLCQGWPTAGTVTVEREIKEEEKVGCSVGAGWVRHPQLSLWITVITKAT
jgi:hypothetical protein